MACTGKTFAQTHSRTVELLDQVGIVQNLDAQVPLDLAFRDEDGREVRLAEYFTDQPVILNLVYFECPMLCNRSMDELVRTLRTMDFDVGRQFRVLTVSFDPREGPKLANAARKTILDRYGRAGAGEGWHFLTGNEAEIKSLADTVGFGYSFDENTGQFAHAAGIIVLTPQGRVSRYFYGVDYAARDLRFGLDEASGNRIGSPTDHVLLMLCFQYDPTTGKYGLSVIRAVRAGGVLTVAVLVVGILVMLRRERVKRAPCSATVTDGDHGKEAQI